MKLWSLFNGLLQESLMHWGEAPLSRRLLYGTGLGLLGSGLFHSGVYISQRSGWSGPTSWRKPILFGLSGGVTTLSAAWAAGLVSDTDYETRGVTRSWERRFNLLFASAIIAEVSLITLQTWRGKASHFNDDTHLDNAISVAIDSLVLLISVMSIDLTIRVMRPVSSGLRPKDEVLALRMGLVLFLMGCGLGVWALVYGRLKTWVGDCPYLWGERGVMKFPHGLPLHALQVLPLQSWFLAQTGMKEESRVYYILASTAGFLMMTGYGIQQTLRGKARIEAGPVGGVVAAIGLALIAAPLIAAASLFFGWGRGGKTLNN